MYPKGNESHSATEKASGDFSEAALRGCGSASDLAAECRGETVPGTPAQTPAGSGSRSAVTLWTPQKYSPPGHVILTGSAARPLCLSERENKETKIVTQTRTEGG